jgi:SAM-dependent methyltransferase
MSNTDNTAFDAKAHWQKIYEHKGPKDVSWFQPVPTVSLDLFDTYHVPPTARVIDVGGGDSLLVDHLLDRGHTNVTVLDISGAALQKAQARSGTRASLVTWIEDDATCFKPDATYDVWHDRAVFHFLTKPAQVAAYLEQIARYLRPGGLLILGTFSENGPEKCSGIPVQRYDERTMVEHLVEICERVKCFTVDHVTPFNTVQNFLFCAFRKKP